MDATTLPDTPVRFLLSPYWGARALRVVERLKRDPMRQPETRDPRPGNYFRVMLMAAVDMLEKEYGMEEITEQEVSDVFKRAAKKK